MDKITKKIKKIVCENTGKETIEASASLFNMGIDSITLLYIVNEIEIYYSIKIPDNELLIDNFETIKKISKLVKK